MKRTLINRTVWDHIQIRHTDAGWYPLRTLNIGTPPSGRRIFAGMMKQSANPVGHGRMTDC
jgi:hypothetical protein